MHASLTCSRDYFLINYVYQACHPNHIAGDMRELNQSVKIMNRILFERKSILGSSSDCIKFQLRSKQVIWVINTGILYGRLSNIALKNRKMAIHRESQTCIYSN